MFDLFSTLVRGANAKAVETATDHFAMDLIRQKIREAESGLEAAKHTLATLIVRQRQEERALTQVKGRIKDLEGRTREALAAGKESLANDAATAIADLENEIAVREETLQRLEERTARMRLSIEKANRRIVDLRQGASAASAVDAERRAQGRLNRSLKSGNALHEAEKLIKRVADQQDPFEEAEILDDIDRSLNHENVADRLAAEGFGSARKTSANDVLERLRNS